MARVYLVYPQCDPKGAGIVPRWSAYMTSVTEPMYQNSAGERDKSRLPQELAVNMAENCG